MNYIVFDLEWNRYAREVNWKCPDEIIQIGAVKYNSRLQYIGSFNCLVRPQLYCKMEPTVEKMTGLSMKKLEKEGVPFPDAFHAFKKFLGKKFVLMSWGMQDASVLRSNYRGYYSDAKIYWLARFADLQKYASDILEEEGKQRQIGLKMAADVLSIEYEEESLHDALVDATISGEVFTQIFYRKRFDGYIVDATEVNQHYKNIHITDLTHPSVDRREFKVRCPSCGRFAQKKRGWFKQGNKFVALHACKKCKKDFICTIEVLLTYANAVLYKKRIRPFESSQPLKKSEK